MLYMLYKLISNLGVVHAWEYRYVYIEGGINKKSHSEPYPIDMAQLLHYYASLVPVSF